MTVRRHGGGFTLLEMLIAMSLLAILIVVLYSGLHIGIRSWQTGLAHAGRVGDMRLVESFLRDHLRQSVSVFRSDPDKGRVIDFEGEPRQVAWVAPLMTYLGRGGLYFIQLRQVDQAGGAALQLRWRMYRPDNQGGDAFASDDPNAQTTLIGDVTDFAVSYFGSEQRGQPPVWTDSWHNTQQRPELVRITLAVGGRSWPRLTVGLLD